MLTLDELLARARERLDRVDPAAAVDAVAAGALLVDIRADSQREQDGVIPGALLVSRNVLEWRCAPSSAFSDPRLSDPGRRLIIVCQQGFQSSLAAAELQELGLPLATDLAGGFEAWREAGLPVEPL